MRGCRPHLPVRLAGRQLDELDGARLTGIRSEPGPQQVAEDVAGVSSTVDDIQGNLDEVAGVDDVVGDELCFAFGQPRVAITVEHEDWPAASLHDLEPEGRLQRAALGEEVPGEPEVDDLLHHGVEGLAEVGGYLERGDEPAAVDAEPAGRGAAQLARPGGQRP